MVMTTSGVYVDGTTRFEQELIDIGYDDLKCETKERIELLQSRNHTNVRRPQASSVFSRPGGVGIDADESTNRSLDHRKSQSKVPKQYIASRHSTLNLNWFHPHSRGAGSLAPSHGSLAGIRKAPVRRLQSLQQS